MGWSIGWDSQWQRDIGYGVPATCDHPGCGKEIDRGLAYVCCGQQPYGGEDGCGLFFCGDHRGHDGKCERCGQGEEPFTETPDTAEWMRHKFTCASWAIWRRKNPEAVEKLRKALKESKA